MSANRIVPDYDLYRTELNGRWYASIFDCVSGRTLDYTVERVTQAEAKADAVAWLAAFEQQN